MGVCRAVEKLTSTLITSHVSGAEVLPSLRQDTGCLAPHWAQGGPDVEVHPRVPAKHSMEDLMAECLQVREPQQQP